MPITVNNLPCVAVTDEIAEWFRMIGEDPKAINRMVWPQGASQWSDGRFIVTRETADSIYGDPGGGIKLIFDDGAGGVVTLSNLILLPPRPIHIYGNKIDNPDNALYEIRITDERYNWQFFHVDDQQYNVTKAADRTDTFDAASPKTWEDIVDDLLTELGISSSTNKDLGSLATDTPYDYAFYGDNAAQALDRICAAIGVVFVASWDDIGGGESATRYAISPASSLIQKFESQGTNPYTGVDANTLGGGPEFASSAFSGSGKFFLNRYPSGVRVLFPRQPESDATQENKVQDQFAEYTSVVGKPTIGKAVTASHTLYGDIWAVGPVGSETNAVDLQARADNLSSAYYARFSVAQTKAVWRGYVNKGRFPGEVTWKLTGAGPLSIYSTETDYYGYGLDRSIGNDFTTAPMFGLDGIRVYRSPDGSMRIAQAGASESKFLARITGNATLATDRFKYAWNEVAMDGNDTADVSSGRSGTTTVDFALNTAEINHTSTIQYGVDQGGSDYPAGFDRRPIGAAGATDTHDYDVVVEMTERIDINGAVKYTFQLQGTHDGGCT